MITPKLRFKEFIDEWQLSKISSICKIAKGNGLSKADVSTTGNDCILYGELYTKYNEIIRDVFSKTKQNNKSFIYSNYNDVIIPASGETPEDIAKASCILKNNVILGGDLNILTPINLDGRFLSYEINSKRKKELANLSQGHSVVHLYVEKFKGINIYYPIKKEQEKIANMLELLDKKIELQTKKIEVLKLYKTYSRNELLKDGDKICKLSDILIKWNERNKSENIKYVESISNKNGFVSQNEQFEERNVASKDLNNYYVIRKDVFGYNPSRLNIGSLALKENDKVSVVSPLYECFTTNQNSKFLLEWFNSIYFKKGTISKFEGGVRNTLNFTNLCDIEINLPTIEKQNKYSEYFECINKKISIEENRLNKLIEFKNGLMQNMFV